MIGNGTMKDIPLNTVRTESGTASSPSSAPRSKILDLSRFLRILGAIVWIAAASVYLVQNWDTGSDIERYFLLLAHSVAQVGAAFFCGLQIRESKGARTFLGLTLATMPIHFAVLGGLLYSRLSWDMASPKALALATWVAPSTNMALLTVAAGLIVLLPISYIAFLSLGRVMAGRLTAAYLITNLTLLLPFRGSEMMGFMVIIMAIALARGELKVWRFEMNLQTLEGRIVRGLMWLPALVVIGRTVTLYQFSEIFTGALCATLALLLLSFGMEMTKTRQTMERLLAVIIVPAALAWGCFASYGVDEIGLPDGFGFPLFSLPLAISMLLMSMLSPTAGSNYRRCAALVAIGGAILNLLLYPSNPVALLCLTIAIVTIGFGFFIEQTTVFFSGLAGFGIGLLYLIINAVRLYSIGSWSSLAILALITILSASYLEKNLEKLAVRLRDFRQRLQKWDT